MRAFNEIASPDFKVLGLFIWNVQISKAPYKNSSLNLYKAVNELTHDKLTMMKRWYMYIFAVASKKWTTEMLFISHPFPWPQYLISVTITKYEGYCRFAAKEL